MLYSTTCVHCGANTTNLESHLDHKHVNQVIVELCGGELLTVNRSDGLFRCPWCVDRTKREGKMKLASARAMEVSRSACSSRGLSRASRITSEPAAHAEHV